MELFKDSLIHNQQPVTSRGTSCRLVSITTMDNPGSGQAIVCFKRLSCCWVKCHLLFFFFFWFLFSWVLTLKFSIQFRIHLAATLLVKTSEQIPLAATHALVPCQRSCHGLLRIISSILHRSVFSLDKTLDNSWTLWLALYPTNHNLAGLSC